MVADHQGGGHQGGVKLRHSAPLFAVAVLRDGTALLTFYAHPPSHCCLGDKWKPGESMRLRDVAVALAGRGSLAGVAAARAETYPSKPINLIVPFPAGGPTDTVARIISDHMKDTLGQSVLVETVTGAGATIGVGRVAGAPPDGYTLSVGQAVFFLLNDQLCYHIGMPLAAKNDTCNFIFARLVERYFLREIRALQVNTEPGDRDAVQALLVHKLHRHR